MKTNSSDNIDGLTKRECFAQNILVQLIAVRQERSTPHEIKTCVGLAVAYADELVKQLNKSAL